jgi:hypothetical protein
MAALLNQNLTPQQPVASQPSYDYQWQQTMNGINNLNTTVNALVSFPGFGTGIQDVGSADAPGNSGVAPNDNHVHKGVHKINFTGDAFGDIVFNGAVVTQVGNTFSFAVPAASGLTLPFTSYTDPLADVAVTGFTNFMASNVHGKQFLLPAAAGVPGRIFALCFRPNTAVLVAPANGTDTVESTESRGNIFYQSDGVAGWWNICSINLP